MKKFFNLTPLGGFTPKSLSGLVVWLKSGTGLFQESTFATPSIANNDPIGGWQDQSGQGNHVVQTTASKRPSILTNAVNGWSGVNFDGVDDQLLSANFTGGTLLNETSFVVLNVTGTTEDSIMVSSNSANGVIINNPTANDLNLYNGQNGAYTDIITPGTNYIISILFNGASSNIILNGSLQSNVNPNSTPQPEENLEIGQIFASFPLAGYILEIIKYNRVLTLAERITVDNYLNGKFRVY